LGKKGPLLTKKRIISTSYQAGGKYQLKGTPRGEKKEKRAFSNPRKGREGESVQGRKKEVIDKCRGEKKKGHRNMSVSEKGRRRSVGIQEKKRKKSAGGCGVSEKKRGRMDPLRRVIARRGGGQRFAH